MKENKTEPKEGKKRMAFGRPCRTMKEKMDAAFKMYAELEKAIKLLDESLNNELPEMRKRY